MSASPDRRGSPLYAGQVIGDRYELVEMIGEGGHGAVYRALQRPLGREVAIKMIRAEALLAGGGMLERFAREAGLVQRLEHPNTVRLFDFGTTNDGLPYMVFELLRGRSLERELLDHGPMDPLRVARVAEQVLKSLMEAHDRGIVHRDIKPANVLLVDYAGETDFVKVLDFGVARPVAAATPKNAITHVGEIIGTPSYMAPEQVRGEVVGVQADLYALGLVMAEAATGAMVYGHGSPMQICMQQSSPDPVPLSFVATSSLLGPVIVRAVQKLPEDRYASAAVMLVEVERVVAACNAPTDPLAKPLAPAKPIEVDPTASGSAKTVSQVPETDPLVRPIEAEPAPVTERLSSELRAAPRVPSVPAVRSAPAASASTSSAPRGSTVGASAAPARVPSSRPTAPPRTSGAPLSVRPTSMSVVVAGVIAILFVVVAGVAVIVLLKGRPPSLDGGHAKGPAAEKPVRLMLLTEQEIQQRVTSDGWTIDSASTNHSPAAAPHERGFVDYTLRLHRGGTHADVSLRDYVREADARNTEREYAPAAGVNVGRDGSRVLIVTLHQDHIKTRALFDAIVE